MIKLINELEAIANHSPDFANKIVVEGELFILVFDARINAFFFKSFWFNVEKWQ